MSINIKKYDKLESSSLPLPHHFGLTHFEYIAQDLKVSSQPVESTNRNLMTLLSENVFQTFN